MVLRATASSGIALPQSHQHGASPSHGQARLPTCLHVPCRKTKSFNSHGNAPHDAPDKRFQQKMGRSTSHIFALVCLLQLLSRTQNTESHACYGSRDRQRNLESQGTDILLTIFSARSRWKGKGWMRNAPRHYLKMGNRKQINRHFHLAVIAG